MNRTDILVVIAITGFCAMEVAKMSTIHMIIWLVLMALISFWWIPEIKKLSTKYFSLSKKVSEVMVQYEEFKETVYPLLELELANLASVGYMEAGPKSDKIVDFIERLKKLKIVDSKMSELIMAAKSQALKAFQVELELLVPGSKAMIGTGLTEYISDSYVITDDIYIDFEGLNWLAKNVNDIKVKTKYRHKISELEKFYKNNF